MPCFNRSDPPAILPDANHVWNNIPASHHGVFKGPAQSSYHGQEVNAFEASIDSVHTTSAALQSEQHLQLPTTDPPSVDLTKPFWSPTPTSCPVKTESERFFDVQINAANWDTSNFFDKPCDVTLADHDFFGIPFTASSDRDIHGLSPAATTWNFPSSLSDQSDCSRAFSFTGSLDHPSPTSTYLSDSTYTNPKNGLRGRYDTTHSPDPRLSLGAHLLDSTRLSSQHKLDIPAYQPEHDGEMSCDSNFGALEHCQTTPDAFQTPMTARISWPPEDWDPNAWEHPQATPSQSIAPWNSSDILLTNYRAQSIQSNDTLPQRPFEQINHSQYANPTQDDPQTIRFPNSRRKREDHFLVTSKRKGMTYKQIREKGGLQAAESTLRGRFRALTKDRRDRVRKPVWTDKDIQLLHLAVQREIEGLETSGFSRAADIQALGSKVSWKKVADCIMAKGGSYRFGNATCKKKWKELMH
ncbi:hypothetical protein BU16DRAFT_598758 [Lophium mytilinum]|uniref:Myb-like domain-containing protein n=1 Tax=Lophium mytilinum TaxID=390894 RepID=A0A6A6R9D2_9PEZI|nr:hypothetical protein BU16DRAFT_598758 [Lophium mytilinum]